jgi:outer membrane receptor protein involved in Fe transport
MSKQIHLARALAGSVSIAALIWGGAASAQGAPAPAEAEVEELVVVGSQIRGAPINEALPVRVVDEAQIEATGAVSGDDLLRSIPQMGDVLFSAANNPQTSNAARGDVNSVNLRSLGVGNTLVLVNGRRMVQHPTSQGTSDTGTVPVLSYNSNAIPVTGLRRLEVLLDGAAAIYGADAVAGVVNTVLRSGYDGLRMDLQYGGAESTHRRELQANIFAGQNFDRGNVSAFITYTDRKAQRASDQPYTASADLRPLFAGDPIYGALNGPDARATRGAWANFAAVGAPGVIRQNGTALTSAAGLFHIQPTTFAGCAAAVANGVCLGSGSLSFNGATRDLRYDTAIGTTVVPAVERLNTFFTGEYEITPDLKAFGELGYYTAESNAVQPPVINLNAVTIPASNFYNPLGPVRFADGSLNPNRLPGLTNVPEAGLPVRLTNYRFIDTGPQHVKVKNWQSRFLAGLRGEFAGFDWETALLYSEAFAKDSSTAVNTTALQRQLALSTPDAYNPFNGGCVATPTFGDCSPSSPAAIDAITFDLVRKSKTTLALWDFKVSRPDLFSLPGGDVGIALGVEARRETQKDDRDANLDGTNVFRDAVTGEVNISNVAAVSPNPDTKGSRRVASAYVEFAIPVVSPEMNIPLVRAVNLQVAGRYEHYSDFGSVAKPKVAGSWDLFDGFRVRASYSKGFRAPNLEQTNATQYARLATNNDYVRCEADVRAGRIASFANCARSNSYSLLISGNPDLEPEESTNRSIGVVFEPRFIPPEFGAFTFTADWWRIEQEGIVGLFGGQNALVLDYLQRLQGSSNPNVVRAAPNADDVAFFQGSGLAPVGAVISVQDRFVNLLPQDVRGVDLALAWALDTDRYGDFDVSINAAHLSKFSRESGPAVQQLFDARAAGTINPATPLTDASDLIEQNGRPKWRVSGSLTWRKGPFQVGAFTQFIGKVEDHDFLAPDGTPYPVDSSLTTNLYAQYTFEEDAGWASHTRVRLGARNITNEDPPLSSGGYVSSLYSPYARYWYVNVSKEF